jgi:hypothetical protein
LECPLWVILDRSSWLYLPVDVRFTPKATEVLRYRELTRRAKSRHPRKQEMTANPTLQLYKRPEL